MTTYKNYTEDWKSIAFFLEEIMKNKRMTRNKLADKIGVNGSTLKRFFEHKNCVKFQTLLAIIEGLDIYIFFELEDENIKTNRMFNDTLKELEYRSNGKFKKKQIFGNTPK